MHIGKRILLLRKKKHLSQKSLAKGILSVSHLSNLEAGRHVPSKENTTLLAERLGVPSSYLLDYAETDIQLSATLDKLLTLIITDIKEAHTLLRSIEKPINSIIQEQIYFLLECVYYYKINKLDEAKQIEEKSIDFLIPMNDINVGEMPLEFKKAFYYFQGMRNYRNNNFNDSFNGFSNLLKLPLVDRLKADITYNLSDIRHKQLYYTSAIEYAKIALDNYISLAMWPKVGEAYNFLGVIYWETDMFEDALTYLNKAHDIAIPMGFERLSQRIYHNKGLVYKEMKKYNEALENFYQSFEIKKKFNDTKLFYTFIEIIKCYKYLGKHDQVNELLETAPDYIKNQFHYHVLLKFRSDYDLELGNDSAFLKGNEQAFTFFLENNFPRKARGISQTIGDYYFERNRYKKAAHYYKRELNLKTIKGGELT